MRILNLHNTDDTERLFNLISEGIYQYTNNDIDNAVKCLNKELINKKLGELIINTIPYDHVIEVKKYSFYEYLETGAAELINKMKLLHVKQIAFLKLVNEGKLMPISQQGQTQMQIDVKHKDGNTILLIEFDSYIYNKFIKI